MARTQRTRRHAIVCGTDFSPHASKAAHVAARLAAAWHRSLVLVHASPTAARGLTSTRPMAAAVDRALRREAVRLRTMGATVTVEHHRGHADEVLVARAGDTAAALLVVGALGSRTPTRRFLGSIAERIAEMAPVPTLVVRNDAPFEEWIRHGRRLRVFVGYDFTVTAEGAAAWVNELSSVAPCDVVVGHLSTPPSDERRFGVLDRAPADSATPRVHDLLGAQVRDRLQPRHGLAEAQIDVRPNPGRLDLSLVGMALDGRADLMVVGTHQRHGLVRLWAGSVSRGVVSESPTSVAVIPIAIARSQPRPIPSIHRVLVATDLGVDAPHVIAQGCAVARPGATVRIITVVHPRAVDGGRFENRLGQSPRHSRHLHTVGRRLEALRPDDAHRHDIDTAAAIVEADDPVKAICQEAERIDAQIIVVGTKGTGLTSALVGSVAQGVVAKSRRPVLVVNPVKE